MDWIAAFDYFVYNILSQQGLSMIADQTRPSEGGQRRTGAETTGWRRNVTIMSATEARSAFARVLEIVGRGGVVLITKRGVEHALVMSMERYEALAGVRDQDPDLDALTAEFDALLQRMQEPAVRAGIRAGLASAGLNRNATPERAPGADPAGSFTAGNR